MKVKRSGIHKDCKTCSDHKRKEKIMHCYKCECISCVCDYRVKNNLYIGKQNYSSRCTCKICKIIHYRYPYKVYCDICKKYETYYSKTPTKDIIYNKCCA